MRNSENLFSPAQTLTEPSNLSQACSYISVTSRGIQAATLIAEDPLNNPDMLIPKHWLKNSLAQNL